MLIYEFDQVEGMFFSGIAGVSFGCFKNLVFHFGKFINYLKKVFENQLQIDGIFFKFCVSHLMFSVILLNFCYREKMEKMKNHICSIVFHLEFRINMARQNKHNCSFKKTINFFNPRKIYS